jgi:hypothetical protein
LSSGVDLIWGWASTLQAQSPHPGHGIKDLGFGRLATGPDETKPREVKSLLEGVTVSADSGYIGHVVTSIHSSNGIVKKCCDGQEYYCGAASHGRTHRGHPMITVLVYHVRVAQALATIL